MGIFFPHGVSLKKNFLGESFLHHVNLLNKLALIKTGWNVLRSPLEAGCVHIYGPYNPTG
jgi:hypothetical protein